MLVDSKMHEMLALSKACWALYTRVAEGLIYCLIACMAMCMNSLLPAENVVTYDERVVVSCYELNSVDISWILNLFTMI